MAKKINKKEFKGFGKSNKKLPQLNLDFEKIGIMINPITANNIKEELIKLRNQFLDKNNVLLEEYFIEARKIISTYIKGSSLVQSDDYSKIKDYDPKKHHLQINILTAMLLNLEPDKYIEYGVPKVDTIVFPKVTEAIKKREEESKKGNNELPYFPDLGSTFVEENKHKIITLKVVPEHTITMIHKDMCAIQFCVNAPLRNTVSTYIGVVWFSYMRWQLKYQEKVNNNQPIELLITPWEEKKYIADDQEEITPFQIVDEGESLFTVKTEESLIDSLVCVCGYLVNNIE